MTRTRYRFGDSGQPHFLTGTVVGWLPVFTRPEAVQIILDSLQFLHDRHRLSVLGYVILENHLHLIASADNLGKEKAGLATPPPPRQQFSEEIDRDERIRDLGHLFGLSPKGAQHCSPGQSEASPWDTNAKGSQPCRGVTLGTRRRRSLVDARRSR